MSPADLRRGLRGAIAELPVFDTHEHLQGETGERLTDEALPLNLFDLLSSAYLPAYWNMSGAPNGATIASARHPAAERWAALKPSLERFSGCAAFLALMRAFRDIYEFHDAELTDQNWQNLSKRIEAKYGSTPRLTWLQHILTWARIRKFIGNVIMPYFTETVPGRSPQVADFERRFFIPSPRVDAFLMGCFKEKSGSGGRPSANDAIRDLLHRTKESMREDYGSFDEYLAFVDKAFEIYRRCGVAAIKVTMAYWRTLEIQPVEESQARRIFGLRDQEITPEQERQFQDFMMAHLARKAGEHDWLFHIHTGWGNPDVALGNPALLCNFIRRPDLAKCRFVLFHGWPYVSEFIAVAKNFRQVYLDMVWMPFHSLKATERFLAEMLDALSSNKATVGADVTLPEHTYGTMELVRDLLAKVLAERVADGYITEAVALRFARQILHDNATELYSR